METVFDRTGEGKRAASTVRQAANETIIAIKHKLTVTDNAIIHAQGIFPLFFYIGQFLSINCISSCTLCVLWNGMSQ